MSTVALTPAPDTAGQIFVDKLSFAYPGGAATFADFSLTIDTGFTAILGSSGTGKTTLLRLIAGRLTPTCGAIRGLEGRRLSWMGQSGALLPWASVEDNVLLGARLRGERPDHAKAQALLARMGLAGHEQLRPAQLSGGMRQRVALARTLMEDAEIALLDEPFAHLDAVTKSRLYALTARELAGRTTILVTHDPAEALTLGDRIVTVQGQPARISLDMANAPADSRAQSLSAAHAQIIAALEAT